MIFLKKSYKKKYNINIYNEEEIKKIRKSAYITSKILKKTLLIVKEGISLIEIDKYVILLLKEYNAISATLDYGNPPYPARTCISVNSVMCHGIPNNYVLKYGDIVSLDISLIYDEYFGDCATTIIIGSVSEEINKLVNESYNVMVQCKNFLSSGVPISAIGNYISSECEKKGLTVSSNFVGHGIGKSFHENPNVLFVKNNLKLKLVTGMIFTIEPIIILGDNDKYCVSDDKWSIYSKHHFLSSQHEHMFLINDDGCEILTNWDKDN